MVAVRARAKRGACAGAAVMKAARALAKGDTIARAIVVMAHGTLPELSANPIAAIVIARRALARGPTLSVAAVVVALPTPHVDTLALTVIVKSR